MCTALKLVRQPPDVGPIAHTHTNAHPQLWPLLLAYRHQCNSQTLSRAQKQQRACDEAPVPLPGVHCRACGFGPGHRRHHPRGHPRHRRGLHRDRHTPVHHAENNHRLDKRYLVERASADFLFQMRRCCFCWRLIYIYISRPLTHDVPFLSQSSAATRASVWHRFLFAFVKTSLCPLKAAVQVGHELIFNRVRTKGCETHSASFLFSVLRVDRV